MAGIPPLTEEQIITLMQNDNPVRALVKLRTTTEPLNNISALIISISHPNYNRTMAGPFRLYEDDISERSDLSAYLIDEDSETPNQKQNIHSQLKVTNELIKLLHTTKPEVKEKINTFLEKDPLQRILFLDHFIIKSLGKLYRESKDNILHPNKLGHYDTRSKEYKQAVKLYYAKVREEQTLRWTGELKFDYRKKVSDFLTDLRMYSLYIKKEDPVQANQAEQELKRLMASLTAGGGGSSAADQRHFGSSGGRRKTRNKQRRKQRRSTQKR